MIISLDISQEAWEFLEAESKGFDMRPQAIAESILESHIESIIDQRLLIKNLSKLRKTEGGY